MTFAVAGVLGHNAKTMLLFFVPQIVNFVYSVPQLFRLVPCPRHRMPGYLPATDQLCNSYAEFEPSELNAGGKVVFWLCETFRLAKVERPAGGTVVKLSNLTIINYVLYVCGPMHEATLTAVLLGVQLVCSALALVVRYQLSGLFYDVVK
jgi:UDP-N-acetylglucosamine--dolichyl-phosphate N-acetylglucosaminephosphotransferase